jgi:hypothetical protein
MPMPSVPDAADGCANILALLLRFFRRPSPRSPAADEAAVSLLVVLSTAYVAAFIAALFATVVLAYLHLAGSMPASATAGQFVLFLFRARLRVARHRRRAARRIRLPPAPACEGLGWGSAGTCWPKSPINRSKTTC